LAFSSYQGWVGPILRLKLDSPAIDHGDAKGCRDEQGQLLATDQLGMARPQGTRCDVGASEVDKGN
jgi:hypothetical protein